MCSSPVPIAEAGLPSGRYRLYIQAVIRSRLSGTGSLLLLCQLPLHVVVVFLLQRRIVQAAAAVYVGGLELAGLEFAPDPLVVDVRRPGGLDQPLDRMRRNEVHALPVAKYQVARHDRRLADPDGNVYARRHVSADPRHRTPEVSGHVKLCDTLEIADAAIDDEAVTRLRPDVEGQVVADDAAQVEITAGVDHDHIAGLQHIQGGLVAERDHIPFLLSFRLLHVEDLRSEEHTSELQSPMY